MIHRYRYESEQARRERLHRESTGQLIVFLLLLLGILPAAVWLLLRTVEARGGWMAIF